MRALSELLPFTVFTTILLSDMGFFKNTPDELLLEWIIFRLQWPDFNLSHILLWMKKRRKSSWFLLKVRLAFSAASSQVQ